MYTVYGLFDPRQAHAIRYIGFSNNPEGRLRAHLGEARSQSSSTHKTNWLRSLQRDGIVAEWRPLAVESSRTAAARKEIELIAAAKKAGHDLTNSTAGGDSSTEWDGKLRDAHSRRMARLWKSEARREHHAQRMREFWASQEGEAMKAIVYEKIAAKTTGQTRSPETREKMRLVKLGKPGTPRTPEWIAKISAAQKGIKRRPYTAKERAAKKARMADPVTRAKMSASAKARADRKGRSVIAA